jgi:CheY-like chemotaxis protein
MLERQAQRVLIVDDERVIADTLAMILNQHGFDARAAYSGEIALEISLSLRPDILISDILMAGMSGIELAVRICKQLPNCKVLLISGSGQDVIDDLLQRAHEDHHKFEILRKPLRPEVLLSHLAHVA